MAEVMLSNVVPPKLLTDINKGLSAAADAMTLIQWVSDCGADCAERRQSVIDIVDSLEKFKRYFFPTSR